MEPIDLTLEISNKLPSFPGSPRPFLIPWADKKNEGYNLELVFLSSHSGTHLDAPYHFLAKGLKIDEIPMRRLVIRARLCKVRKGANQLITKKEIIDFEAKTGIIKNDQTIIFETKWWTNLKKKNYFIKNPGLAASAARYLSSKKINLVGIDGPSIDAGKDSKFTAHHILLKNDILILENLCNLQKLDGTNFLLVVLPLKLKGATGSPVRAIAI